MEVPCHSRRHVNESLYAKSRKCYEDLIFIVGFKREIERERVYNVTWNLSFQAQLSFVGLIPEIDFGAM
jgi:hypothetical protein